MMMLSQINLLQEQAKRLLVESLKTDQFTLSQKIKVFQHNFDEFILGPTLKDLREIGYSTEQNLN